MRGHRVGAPTTMMVVALAAGLHASSPHWQAVGEWQHLRSACPARALMALPIGISETQFQSSTRRRVTLQR